MTQAELAIETTRNLMDAFDRALDVAVTAYTLNGSTVGRLPDHAIERVRSELAGLARALASAFVGPSASSAQASQAAERAVVTLLSLWGFGLGVRHGGG